MHPEKLQGAFRNLKEQSLHSVNSIKSFDFSTLYTTIPHGKLKSKVKEITVSSLRMVTVAFSMFSLATKTDTSLRITLMNHKNTQTQMSKKKMLEYLIDNIFVEFGGRIFQQTIGIRMGTNCAHLLADMFILVWGGVCTKSPQSRQETPCTTIQFLLQIYRWCIVSLKKNAEYLEFIYPRKGNNGDYSLLLTLGLLSLHWQWKTYY